MKSAFLSLSLHSSFGVRWGLRGLTLAAALCASVAQAQSVRSTNGLNVTTPNGYAVISTDDMVLRSDAGAVRWGRQWDGQEWRFNPHWESLSQSWKNLTGSQSADTTSTTVTSGSSGGAASGSTSGSAGSTAVLSSGSSGAGGSGGGCWVWVDEDWQPSYGTAVIGGLPQAEPVQPARLSPFNKVMGEDAQSYAPLQRVSVDYASLCAGAAVSMPPANDVEAIRRNNELYLGDNGRYAFSNRAVLEKREVKQIAAAPAEALYASLGTGRIALSPQANDKGYRWLDKSGDWIDYNTQGQVVAYGDRNNNSVWLARDTGGRLLGVVDPRGRVLYTLHYTGQLLTEVKDHPVAGLAGDLPARSVKYAYDERNRLVQVTDVRGHVTKYDYNVSNRLIKITDAEGRSESLAYTGDAVSRHTAADGAVTDYVFEFDDANKQFISKVTGPQTEAGRRVEDLTHNRAGKPVRHLVNGRTDLEVAYDTGARAEIQTNARGFRTRQVRNEFDQIVRVEHPDGAIEQMAFSALNLQLTEVTDPLGNKTRYERDAAGNLVRKIEAVGLPEQRTTTYQVNARGLPERITHVGRTEANGRITPDAVWQVTWDELGQISQTTDPEGAVRRYVYDRAGNLTRYTDPRGKVTTFEVDAAGLLVLATDPLGHTRRFTLDKVGNVRDVLDERGKRTQTAYDALNRPTQVTTPVGGLYRTGYNGQGLPTSEVDEDGRTTLTEYDNFLRQLQEVDGRDNKTRYGYNVPDGSAAGTLGSLLDPTEVTYPTFTERNRYDERERLTSQTLSHKRIAGDESITLNATYDKRGFLTSETDGRGKVRRYRYDALGQLVETTDALGNKTLASYDARGNIIAVTDPHGGVSRFEYDRNDRVVVETLPLGQSLTYEYNASGQVVRRVDANGDVVSLTHDDAGRVTEVRQARAGQVIRTTRFTWDAADNLTAWEVTDATRPQGEQLSSGTATYDDANRKLSESVTLPNLMGGTHTLSHAYQYTLAGKKSRITWADGTAIDYAYSAHGELETVSIPGEGSISVNEFKWRAPVQLTLPGGSTQTRVLDGLLNLESLKVKAPGQQSVLELTQVFGKNLERRSVARTDVTLAGSTTRTQSFEYDDENRLTQVSLDRGGLFGSEVESFGLDALGNRISHSRSTGDWVYDANNRLIRRGSGAELVSYRHDEVGNVIEQTGPAGLVRRFRYDAQRRLVGIEDGAGQVIARYGYDPLDRRIWREQHRDRAGVLLAQPLRTLYLHADEGLIAEATQPIAVQADGRVTAQAAPALTTQYGVTPDSEVGTDVLFVRTRDTNGQDTFAYLHRDDLGRPLQATNKSGRVVWLAQYDAFGRAQVNTLTATPQAPLVQLSLRLPGQTEDPESGLHYNHRRYYDPDTGRYLTSDPLGLAGGINTYAYVMGDPVNAIDPTGEIAPAVGAAAAAAARAYARCFAKCMLQSVAKDAVTGECIDPGKSAKDCAIKCLNPFNWGKGGGKGKGKDKGWGGGAPPTKNAVPPSANKPPIPKPPRGKGSVPPADRDPKRAYPRDEVAKGLEKNGGTCAQCGKELGLGDAKGHHVQRHADGGKTTPDNLAVVCGPCHKDIHKP